jgi:hypothetical protein
MFDPDARNEPEQRYKIPEAYQFEKALCVCALAIPPRGNALVMGAFHHLLIPILRLTVVNEMIGAPLPGFLQPLIPLCSWITVAL